MTYSVRFLPEVEDDAVAGYIWYEAKVPGLGAEFLRIFYAAATEIARHPFMCAKLQGEFRRKLLRRFPYSVYFTVAGCEVIVSGLFHSARDPVVVGAELQDRRNAGAD